MLGEAATAQLDAQSGVSARFDSMRRMRNDSEYPMPDSRGPVADRRDAEDAIGRARAIIERVEKALDLMGMWTG
jgi:hypothetical protein